MTIRLVHGIREFKAESHMQPIYTALVDSGLDAAHVTYGPIWIPVTNERAVNAVMESVEPGDDVVAFSNGCWAVHQALELGLKVRNLYVISGALNTQAVLPNVSGQTLVYYSAGDNPTLAARWYRRTINKLAPWRWRKPHGWGAMGRYGIERELLPHERNIDMGRAVGHKYYDYENTIAMIVQDICNGAT